MYIYQYGGELYWIADFEYEFKADGNNRIEYQINTTQVQNLPKDRLDNGWHWSNIGFVFEENEIVMDDSWRVAKCRLPEEYSITDIGSGHKINDWVWQHNFRPWYEFK